MWAYSRKIAEIGNFWYKFAHKGYTSLSDFLYTKFGLREGLPVRTLTPNFTVLA